MKSNSIFCLLFLSYSNFILAQEIKPHEIVENMSGNFEWAMVKPKSKQIVRRGKRTTEQHFNGQILFFCETFYDSEIEQLGFFGYDTKTKEIVSVGLYNIDLGPHILRGMPQRDGQGYRVAFYEGNKKIILTIKSPKHHYWQYYSKENRKWIQDDLQIDFRKST